MQFLFIFYISRGEVNVVPHDVFMNFAMQNFLWNFHCLVETFHRHSQNIMDTSNTWLQRFLCHFSSAYRAIVAWLQPSVLTCFVESVSTLQYDEVFCHVVKTNWTSFPLLLFFHFPQNILHGHHCLDAYSCEALVILLCRLKKIVEKTFKLSLSFLQVFMILFHSGKICKRLYWMKRAVWMLWSKCQILLPFIAFVDKETSGGQKLPLGVSFPLECM